MKNSQFLSPSFIKAVCALRSAPATFYASDLGLNGGQICALGCAKLIRYTGNTKVYYVDIDDEYAKKVKVYEWQINQGNLMRMFNRVMPRQLEQLSVLINTLTSAMNS